MAYSLNFPWGMRCSGAGVKSQVGFLSGGKVFDIPKQIQPKPLSETQIFRKYSRRGSLPVVAFQKESAPPPATTETPKIIKEKNGTGLEATLLIQCPDHKGVVASLAQLLYGLSCNILSSDQYTESDTGAFFQRVLFDYSDLVIGTGNLEVLERHIADLASKHDMDWRIFYSKKVKNVALMVSKYDHCLFDLLVRHRSGELDCKIPVIISNHPDLEAVARTFDVDFRHVPIIDKKKREQELEIENILAEMDIDLIVLARYMQIMSPEFCAKHWRNAINIHHSFLPAFEGAKPYHRAHERGVKIIGATAHYATSDLDAGPIIEQDVARITHRDSVKDMIRKGRDLERLVLARAVRWHLEDRVLVHGNRTVVFE